MVPSTLAANSKLILKENKTSYSNFKVDFLMEDMGEDLGIEKISKLHFNKQISNAFSLGYIKNNLWFHFSIYNDSSLPKEMVLEFTEIIHKKLDLYVLSNGVTHMKNGLRIPVKNREIQESNPSFPLYFSPNEKKEIYINLASIYGVFGAIEVKTTEQFQKDVQLKKYLYLFYFTSVIIIALYNLILFFYLREKIYLLYISHIFVFIIWAANYKGMLLPFITMKTYDLLQITIPTFFILLILFSQSILGTKKYFPILHKILYAFIGISIISFIWMLFEIHSGFLFMNISAIPLLPFLLIVAIWALYKKHNIAFIYLIALTIYIIGMSQLSLLALGVLPYSIVSSNSAIIGSFLEVIFFSLLLAYRINDVRQESLRTQEELVAQQKTESTRLFHTVAEKTMALNHAKEQLEKELDKKEKLEKHLKHLASTDPMTELFNRRAFFDISDKAMLDSQKKSQKLTCLIVDIDHFKMINDSYGHDMGDKVIIDVSKLMLTNTRSIDSVGRVGGEEFAILMPNTDKDAAYQIADRLRKNIAKHKMSLHGETVQITVSIGLSTLTEEDTNIHTVLKRADSALYQAKENGRNQVQMSL
jgi:diguanylate cyclase (GGDEF)-like protein